MAVGKGSMDRASRALKSSESKAMKESQETTFNTEAETVEGKKTEAKSQGAEEAAAISVEMKKNTGKKSPAKKAAGTTRKPAAKGKKEVKTSVIATTDPQVLDLIEKTREEKEKKEDNTSNVICAIGDEMPVYFL